MLTFENELTVQAPLEVVWASFQDIPFVAECVPGARITGERDGNEFDGQMQVKVGAISMVYAGTVTIVNRDALEHRLTLQGQATERTGGGRLAVDVECRLSEEGDTTGIQLTSHVNLTGRAAQFGRGILQSVAASMLKKFGTCLETRLAEAAQQPAAG